MLSGPGGTEPAVSPRATLCALLYDPGLDPVAFLLCWMP